MLDTTDTVGRRVRSLRQLHALSQEELAAKAGVSRATVIKMENGRASWPSTVRKLARALGVKPAQLTGLDVEDVKFDGAARTFQSRTRV